MKILIVDDSLLDRKLLMKTIASGGIDCEILQAADGEEGLNVLGDHHEEIGLILLDWQMPKMSGIEFMQVIRKIPKLCSIPIIMITASAAEDSRALARETNPDLAGYIVKPYKPEKLIEMIKIWIK